MALNFIMTLWIGNGAVLTSSSQWQLTLSQTTNSLLFQTEILFQTERVCRQQFQFDENDRKVSKGRKHCGKRRNCSSRAISPFSTVFSKDLYSRHVKTRACLGKG